MATPEHEEMQRSTRDYEVMRADLQRWIAGSSRWCESGDHLLRRALEERHVERDDPVRRRSGRGNPLLRRPRGARRVAVPVFQTYDLERQYHVMSLVASRTEVPVPPLRWLELDPARVGAAFLVMDRVDGEVPRTSCRTTSAAGFPRRLRRNRSNCRTRRCTPFAALHDMDAAPRTSPSSSSAARRRAPCGRTSTTSGPITNGWPRTCVIRCSSAALPGSTTTGRARVGPVLSWGDARIGNVIYRNFTPAALLDWEIAAVGPRELDLGWLVSCMFLRRHRAEPRSPRHAPLPAPDDVAAATRPPPAIPLGPRVLFAVHSSPPRRDHEPYRTPRIHFGEVEMPGDPDEPHHAPWRHRGDAGRNVLAALVTIPAILACPCGRWPASRISGLGAVTRAGLGVGRRHPSEIRLALFDESRDRPPGSRRTNTVSERLILTGARGSYLFGPVARSNRFVHRSAPSGLRARDRALSRAVGSRSSASHSLSRWTARPPSRRR